MIKRLLMGAVALALSAQLAKADQVQCMIDNAEGGGNATAFHCSGDPSTFWYGVQNSGTNQGYITTIKLRYEEYAIHALNPFNTPSPVPTLLDVTPLSTQLTPCLINSSFVPAPSDGTCTTFAGIK